MTKQELLSKLTSSETLVQMAFVPVAEVIKWVNELEEAPINDELIDDIVDEIIGEDMDLIEDYDLSMSYREVELDSIKLDDDIIRRAVKRAFNRE